MNNEYLEDWERDDEGDIKLCPLQLLNIATDPAATFLALRIYFWKDGDASDRPTGGVQLGLTARIARDLTQSLLPEAEQIDENATGLLHKNSVLVDDVLALNRAPAIASAVSRQSNLSLVA